ncbi:uncharacterized protein MONBRDRAFT_38323 [Monosiga brevicollis MX1]|uniref:EGF-like domain-containing protein n=1 Tax=Monosiga brevicollis TaxID=81824 RepID=A9V702_MONBE|nr:uncharacterized protein MONBRDRAFT_38323 [Monosiga brevicollis MX1]EDQ86704.1 predicted protein [Monosiga brevicollis MX1]|eukprot:XP_001748540.1 hypothetical protein [Monosiga brevicollis MX1]
MMNSDDDDSDDDDSDVDDSVDDDSDVDDSVDDYDEFAPFCPIDPPHQEHSPNGGEGADSAAQTLVQPLAREELEAGEDSANNFFAALSASTTQTAVAVPEPPAAGTTSNLALATFTSTAPASVNPVPVASASVVPPSDIAASIASSTDARVTLLQTNTNAFNCPDADAIAKTPNPDLTTNLSSGLLLGPTETHHAQNTKRQSPLSRTAARQRKKQELLSRVPFGGDVSHLLWYMSLPIKAATANPVRSVYRLAAHEAVNISDGEGNYQPQTEREYLFQGAPTLPTICARRPCISFCLHSVLTRIAATCLSHLTAAEPGVQLILTFRDLATECQYDYFFVYDGGSYNATLLAVLSGDDLPPEPLTATSGQMLLMFYSDTNYVLRGYDGIVQAVPCVDVCAHGTCIDAQCRCAPGWTGPNCAKLACPSNCSGHGSCSEPHNRCVCEPGYAGDACEQPTTSGTWWTISPTDPVFGMRQQMASCYTQSAWYVFGGYSFDTVHRDLVAFDFETGVWQLLHGGGNMGPSARQLATLVALDNEQLLLYGGVYSGQVLADLWSFDLLTSSWTQLDPQLDCTSFCLANTDAHRASQTLTLMACPHAPANCSLPPLAGHSAVMAEDSMYLIGGRSETDAFESRQFRYDAVLNLWQALPPARHVFTEAVGHTSVYHPATRAIYSFGGVRPYHAQYGDAVDDLDIFFVDTQEWIEAPRRADAVWPSTLAFHAALLIDDDTMVMYGGFNNLHYEEESIDPECHEGERVWRWLLTTDRSTWRLTYPAHFNQLSMANLFKALVLDTHVVADAASCAAICLARSDCRGFDLQVIIATANYGCRTLSQPRQCLPFLGADVLPVNSSLVANASNAGTYFLPSPINGSTSCHIEPTLNQLCGNDCGLNATCIAWNVSNASPTCRCNPSHQLNQGVCDDVCHAYSNNTQCTDRDTCFDGLWLYNSPSDASSVCVASHECDKLGGIRTLSQQGQRVCRRQASSRSRRSSSFLEEPMCFADQAAAGTYFRQLASFNANILSTLPATAFSQSSTSGLAVAGHAAVDIEPSLGQDQACAVTQPEPTPSWQVIFNFPLAVGEIHLYGAAALPALNITVYLQSNNTALPCADVTLTSAGTVASCSGLVGDLLVVRARPAPAAQLQQLGLCYVAAFVAETAQSNMSRACGGPGHGEFVAGSCDSPCELITDCRACAASTSCGWCASTGTCLDVSLEAESDCASTSMATDPAACSLTKATTGVVRRLYDFYGSLTLSTFEQCYDLEHAFPRDVELADTLSSPTSGRTPYGEEMIAYLTPTHSANYTFFLRNRQGLAANLFLAFDTSRGSTDAMPNLERIVSLPALSPVPQLSWTVSSRQRSASIPLEAGRRYLVRTLAVASYASYYGQHQLLVAWSTGTSPDAFANISDADVIPPALLTPFAPTNCSDFDSCRGCLSTSSCTWCNGLCVASTDLLHDSVDSCEAHISSFDNCPDCSDFTECTDCLDQAHCEYASYYCRHTTPYVATREVAECPSPCYQQNDCASCAALVECGWCATTQSCFPFHAYLSEYPSGGCLDWQTDASRCSVCEAMDDCYTCTTAFECGWAYNASSPHLGRCVVGDFGGPRALATGEEGGLSDRTLWAYDVCPQVDECSLGLDNCNVTFEACVDVNGTFPNSFRCECADGYRPTSSTTVPCLPDCPAGCVHGACVAPNVCACASEWTGPTCEGCILQSSGAHPCGVNASCAPAGWIEPPEGYVNATNRTDGTDPSHPLVCRCNEGYAGVPDQSCAPVCETLGCVHGECVAPDVCRCVDGFAGGNCTSCDTTHPDYDCSPYATCQRLPHPYSGVFLFNCTCRSGFEGDGHTCVPVCFPECHAEHGRCISPNVCACEAGWMGAACRECDPDHSPCGQDAECVASLASGGQLACTCAPGYQGDPMERCEPICAEGCVFGTCVAPNECSCFDGFGGAQCDLCNPNMVDVCQENAACEMMPAQPGLPGNETRYQCVCAQGYEEEGAGANLTCMPTCPDGCDHGQCQAVNTCVCAAGFANSAWTNCSECAEVELVDFADDGSGSALCTPHASCTDQDGLVLCRCRQGYRPLGSLSHAKLSASIPLGYAGNETDDDPVLVGFEGCLPVCTMPCANGGTCVAADTCNCTEEWGGSACTECPETNACAAAHAQCTKLDAATRDALFDTPAKQAAGMVRTENETAIWLGSYLCQCEAGYAGDGTSCTPVCPLACVHGNCTAPGACTCDESLYVPGVPAWSGPQCTECVEGTHDCHPNASCTSDAAASRACVCDEGFTGNGSFCSPICSAGCVFGTCEHAVRPGGYGVCVCDAGFDGQNCSTCIQGQHGCAANASCATRNGQLQCVCDEGYQGDGYTCAPICTLPCVNGGSCVAPDECQCALGYTGALCELECGCNKHATCTDGPGLCDACQEHTTGALCERCAEGYYGNATNGGACQPCPCNGHGSCDPQTGTCSCDAVTEGPTCNVCRPGLYGNPLNGGPCMAYCSEGRNRIALTLSSGYLGSGPGSTCPNGLGAPDCYEIDHSCITVLVAPNPELTIVLEMVSFQTECHFDLLRVFEGPSLRSPQLGTLSGLSLPPTLRARGNMTLHWWSDELYAMQGYVARYSVQNCSDFCAHGRCVAGACLCDAGFTGYDCSEPRCSPACDATRGSCNPNTGHCLCLPGRHGTDCQLNSAVGGWTERTGVLEHGLAGHSLTYDATRDILLLVGGRTGEGSALGFRGKFGQGTVKAQVLEVTPESMALTVRARLEGTATSPSPRYRHAAALLNNTLWVFGGLNDQHQLNDELWRLDLQSWTWSPVVPAANTTWPPACAGHQLISAEGRLYLIGGRGYEDGLLDVFYVYDPTEGLWQEMSLEGASPAGAMQSVVVFDEARRRILLHGGRGQVRMTNGIFNQAAYFQYGKVLASGSAYDEAEPLNCYESEVFVYDLACESWLSKGAAAALGYSSPAPMPGYTESAAAVRWHADKAQLLAIGGFDGVLSRNAYVLQRPRPEGCAPTNASCGAPAASACPALPPCSSHTDCEMCASDDRCKWAFHQSQDFAGLLGTCFQEDDDFLSNDVVIREQGLCNLCGNRAQCSSCAGLADPGHPGAGGTPGRCGWYENPPFQHHFCLSPASPVTVIRNIKYSPATCPASCSEQHDCASCSDIDGCSWCEDLQECFDTSNYIADTGLGECLHQATSSTCPAGCAVHRTCASCLSDAACGWCLDTVSQTGLCVAGDAAGANNGTCVDHLDVAGVAVSRLWLQPSPVSSNTGPTNGPAFSDLGTASADNFTWHYFACPPVTVCDGLSNACSSAALCNDLDVPVLPGIDLGPSFECVCRAGYSGDGTVCQPLCETYGCVPGQGTCTAPDVCSCALGFSGVNCSSDCRCNGHSACDANLACGACQHNTEGVRCERCRDGFFGDATVGQDDDCTPCLDVCNQNTNECYSSIDAAPNGMVCRNCAPSSHATGPYCRDCLAGYQRLTSSLSGISVCRECPCNGHSDRCDPEGDETSCECDSSSHAMNSAAGACTVCRPGYDAASNKLELGEPCYRTLTTHSTYNTVMSRASVYPTLFGSLSAGAFRPGDAQVGLDVVLQLASGRVQVIVSTNPTWKYSTGESPCRAPDCLVYSCGADGCTRLASVTAALAMGHHDRTYENVSVALGEPASQYASPLNATISLPCTEFDFYHKKLYFALVPETQTCSNVMHLAPSTTRDLRCARCVDCELPCSPGYFLDPAEQGDYLCRPCACNGHGDSCNVKTGGNCGVQSQGCQQTGLGCQCAHNTQSVPVNGLPVYAYQCNACVGSSQLRDNVYQGTPENGRRCYRVTSVESVVTPTLSSASTDARFEFYAFSTTKYTNVDLRLAVLVWSGEVRVVVTLDTSPVVNDTVWLSNADNQSRRRRAGEGNGSSDELLQINTTAVVADARVTAGRRLFLLRHEDYAFSDAFRVFVVLEAVSAQAEVMMYSEQNLTSINLVVFFANFFTILFLCVGLGAIAFVARRRYQQWSSNREQQLELEQMSRRPWGRIRLVLREDIPPDVMQRLLFRPRPMPRALRTWCLPTPIAEQPLVDSTIGGMVATYMVELPGGMVPSRLTLGVSLVAAQAHTRRRRRGTGGGRHSSSVATSAL